MNKQQGEMRLFQIYHKTTDTCLGHLKYTEPHETSSKVARQKHVPTIYLHNHYVHSLNVSPPPGS